MNRDQIRKARCDNGALGTMMRLRNVSPEEIIIDTYIHTENEVAKYLAKQIEYMLLLAKTNYKKYEKERDTLHMQLARWIHENKCYREWVDFIYIAHNFKHESTNQLILSAYLSELMENWNYLTNYEEDIYGLTSTNELLTRPEYYGDWDIELIELRDKFDKGKITKERYIKESEKMLAGDKPVIEANENMMDIATFSTIPFINERTKNIVPEIWYPQAESGLITPFPRMWKPTEFYKEQLRKRKFMIDRKGVKAYLKNAGKFTEIMFMEDVTKDNKIVMLFRLSIPEGSTIGYYHLQDEIFFTCYKDSDNGKSMHFELENLVLELYTEIVCGLEKDRKRLYAITEVEDIDNIENYKSSPIYVQYQTYNKNTDKDELSGKRKRSSQREHDRRFAIRKLQEGQTASEEAVERALELGIELQEGYTFVKSYHVGGSIKDVRKELVQNKK